MFYTDLLIRVWHGAKTEVAAATVPSGRLNPETALRRTFAVVARRVNPVMGASLFVIAACVVTIALASIVTRTDPFAQNVGIRLQAPSAAHPFGTDQLGRDVFSRVLHGGRTSLPAAAAVVLFGFVAGTTLGAIAGFVGGPADEAIMRLTEMVLAFPIIILAMTVAAALGASLIHGVIALAAAWWPQYARVCRSLVLDLRPREYVLASRALGRTAPGILLRVILPNAIPSLLVMASIDVGRAILNFAMLSFLGLGVKPPTPEWGSMVASGAEVIDQWWVSTFPALAILILVLAFNLVGDSVRDAMDPWLRGRR
jgi:peptide/nickel transport system permease protein